MENKRERFKQKGQSILSGPNSMKDFLEEQKDTQMHKTIKPQKHKSPNVKSRNYTQDLNGCEQDNDKLERIHVQIRKDLADKLIEMVYVRKRQGKKGTQRHIIEQALEEYFAK
jgi:glutamyl-tRNA reductase